MSEIKKFTNSIHTYLTNQHPVVWFRSIENQARDNRIGKKTRLMTNPARPQPPQTTKEFIMRNFKEYRTEYSYMPNIVRT